MDFSLVMKLTDGTERTFPLRHEKTLIGRETRCHVRIALPNVAERHCEIVLDGGELTLSDLGSELGTLVNGEPVRQTVINPADELTVGPVTFRVRQEQPQRTSDEPDAAAEPDSELALKRLHTEPADRPSTTFTEIADDLPQETESPAARSRREREVRNASSRRSR